ncbi:DUF721 domain-containing protein [Streptomyces scabiei]|uniref:DUF721 domain-containing protein n=1 Tax=Streptomyces caniscabiei TaxID=2746961 RepID=UPI00117FC659
MVTSAVPAAPEPEPAVDLARLTFQRAQEDARRGRFRRTPAAVPQPPQLRTRTPPAHLGHVLSDVVSRIPSDNPMWTSLLMKWPSLVGAIALHVHPARFDAWSSTLTLHSPSSAWITQVRLIEDSLIRLLNDALGPGSVHRIRFKKTDHLIVQLPRPVPEPVTVPKLPPLFPDPAVDTARQLHGQRLPRESARPTGSS